jgi:Bacterial SH3 domain
MEIGGAASEAKTGDTGTPTPRRASRMGLVLSGLAGLLILAGVIYYFTDHGAVTDVATSSSPGRPAESSAVASNPSTPDNPEKPASPAASPPETTSAQPQSPQPTELQQSARAPTPPPAGPVETPAAPSVNETPATPLATTAQNTPTKSQPSESAPPPQSGAIGAATQAGSTAQPSMRDQPAALPDQSAVTPKKENILIVMRGPANIRSAPGKNGRVIGTAPKDATVKELDRSGNWVQVETDATTGWINATLLGTRSSESR